MFTIAELAFYMVRLNKTYQHKNRDFSEMHEYFLPQILLACLAGQCPQVQSFNLLNISRNGGSPNFKTAVFVL